MEYFTFDAEQAALRPTDSGGQPLSLLERALRTITPPTGYGTTDGRADRTHFYPTNAALRDAIVQTDLELVDPEEAEATVALSQRQYGQLEREGALPLTTDGLRELAASRTFGSKIELATSRARQRRLAKASDEAWWRAFDDTSGYTRNVFTRDPFEQIIIGHDQPFPVTVYNFCQPMTHGNIRDIAQTVHILSELTHGYSRLIVPNIVMHDDFKPSYFKRSKEWEKPAGQARHGEPFVEIGANAFVAATRGRAGQSWMSRVVAHEIFHQIDDALHPDIADFTRFFSYIDANGDGLIDYTIPRAHLARRYPRKVVEKSAPHRDYGLTNAYEDLSVAGEESAFGGAIDELRHDALDIIIREFIADQESKRGPEVAAQLSKTIGHTALSVVRRTGREIILPTVEGIDTPLRIGVTVRPSLAERIGALVAGSPA